MSKKTVIISLLSLLTVAAIGVYFFVVPGMHAESYVSEAKKSLSTFENEATQLAKTIDSSLYNEEELTATDLNSKVGESNRILESLEDELAVSKEKLTNYQVLPLLGWTASAKDASAISAAAAEYITACEKLIAEIKPQLEYFSAFEDVLKETEKVADLRTSLESAADEAEFAAILDEAATLAKSITEDSEAIKPPTSLKAVHDASTKSTGELAALLADMSAAINAQDYEALATISEEMLAVTDEYTEKSKQLIRKFDKESELRKFSDQVANLQREVNREVARY